MRYAVLMRNGGGLCAKTRNGLLWESPDYPKSHERNGVSDPFSMPFYIVSRKLGVVAAEGDGVIFAFDYREGKKAPLPDEVRRCIAPLEASIQ